MNGYAADRFPVLVGLKTLTRVKGIMAGGISSKTITRKDVLVMDEKKGKRYQIVKNPSGPDLGYVPESGVKIIERDGLYFKDHAKTGELLPFEDWRLDADTRAKDLAARLSVEQIAGLMLYSKHQMVPFTDGAGPFSATYDGKSFEESRKHPWALTDQQKKFLTEDNIRHVLAMKLDSAEIACKWNNEMQALAEKLPFGIPVNTSSDPRHGAAKASAEYKGGAAGDTSKWPEGLGMAATFSPELCEAFGKVIAEEYRAMGITTALSPQIDLATEPRWMRAVDTFGVHAGLAADMARAYCDGLQTTEGAPNGWGKDSVIAMAKHWPGGGSGEGGRDAHYVFGKYAVYPSGNFAEHLKPFLNGAFRLNGPTGTAAAVMPYYTVSWGQDTATGENVGNSYSTYIIQNLLREKYGYDGVVCTDWGITADEFDEVDAFGSRCFGVEHLTETERHLKIIMNGVDQFGGNDASGPVIAAYWLGCERYGEPVMRARYEQAASRLLRGMFRCGLFENPYLDSDKSKVLVGSAANIKAGYEAQLKSIIMLKNKKDVLPLAKKQKIYVPDRRIGETIGFFRNKIPAHTEQPVPVKLLSEYFIPVETPEEADAAIVFIQSPETREYSREDRAAGGNGYFPISLQYRPYQAKTARATSIAGGDPLEDFTNRSYRDKTVCPSNTGDLDNVIETKRRMGDKPVIVVLQMNKSTIPAEFEPYTDALLTHYGVQLPAIFDIITGAEEPSGLLPMQLPKDMETVEAHSEDASFDLLPYIDSEGNAYDFGFGMNWKGRIMDARTKRYKKPV